MNPLLRQLASTFALLSVAATFGVAGGYAYAHDPQREVLTIAVDASRTPASETSTLSGAVIEISNGRLRVETSSGPVDLALPASTRVEELRMLAASALTPGTYVNVGVERSDSSIAISGIVALEAAR